MKTAFVVLVCSLSLGFTASQAQAPAAIPLTDQIQPNVLAANTSKALILYVGFPTLYKSNHIPNAVLAGPASNATGLTSLKQALEKVSKDREIVIYCGCCPWNVCPNIRPAFDLLKKMGYAKVKALVIESNLDENWIKKGHPVEKGN